jgi:hypothetical protein
MTAIQATLTFSGPTNTPELVQVWDVQPGFDAVGIVRALATTRAVPLSHLSGNGARTWWTHADGVRTVFVADGWDPLTGHAQIVGRAKFRDWEGTLLIYVREGRGPNPPYQK